MSDENCFMTDTAVRREIKKKFFISYRRLKTQKHSVSIGHFRSVFFMNILIDNLQRRFFYIQDRKMCLSKKVLYQYIVVFCPAWDSFSYENILYVTA